MIHFKFDSSFVQIPMIQTTFVKEYKNLYATLHRTSKVAIKWFTMIRFSSRRLLWGFIPPAKIYDVSLTLSLFSYGGRSLDNTRKTLAYIANLWGIGFSSRGGRNTSSRTETKEKSPEGKKRLDSKNCLLLFWRFQRNCRCWRISVSFCKNSASRRGNESFSRELPIFFFFFLIVALFTFFVRVKSNSALLHFFRISIPKLDARLFSLFEINFFQ